MSETIPNLQDEITTILENNAGGVKFMDLLSYILNIHKLKNPIEELKDTNDAEIGAFLLRKLEEMEGVGILNYSYKTLKRRKYFVYWFDEED